jgi:SMC interacting uncharacterized protein involved in chromosome segregation
MSTKTNNDNSFVTPITDEVKEQNSKYTFSKFEYDLYHEEDDIAEKVIRVKRSSMPNKGEKWKVMQDNKVIFTIESTKISKREREYLQTVEGFNFILAQAKTGIKSLNSFRTELKKTISKSEEVKVEASNKKVPKKRGRKKINKS